MGDKCTDDIGAKKHCPDPLPYSKDLSSVKNGSTFSFSAWQTGRVAPENLQRWIFAGRLDDSCRNVQIL
jgi:hypothetical protein